ncbi:hypothetical protein T03_9528 [Trichinella britovi]|uniref:Uncharacterized protein n=1 Tax=Trichinella britovi TaxID=45882 RepID=A0A0V1ALQ4_TRIBR|nr:hypothetical protein T03_9528 [Trichinella britovi]
MPFVLLGFSFADLRLHGDARCPTQEYVSSADSRSFTMEIVEALNFYNFQTS